MSIYIGNTPLKSASIGDTSIKSIYKGSTLLWSSGVPKLSTPEVDINSSGVASWSAITNAVGYECIINEQTTNTTETEIQLSYGQKITVKALGDGISYADSDYSTSKTYDKPEFSIPVVSITSSGQATWNAITDEYKINNGSTKTTTSTSVTLEDGDTITVRALPSDTTNYNPSAWSTAKTYNKQKLATPDVSISEYGEATWEPIDNAGSYKYKINNGIIQTTDDCSVYLQDGDCISVQAISSTDEYSSSDWSEELSFELEYYTLTVNLERVDDGASPDYSVSYLSVMDDATGEDFLSENVIPASGSMAENKSYQISIPFGTTVRVSWEGEYSCECEYDSGYSEVFCFEADNGELSEWLFEMDRDRELTIRDIIYYIKFKDATDEILEYAQLKAECCGKEYTVHDGTWVIKSIKTCCHPNDITSDISYKDLNGSYYEGSCDFTEDPAYNDGMHWICSIV